MDNEEMITLSKEDYAKAIQSAEDKLRTSYSKQIKDMQATIDELRPVEKTDDEIDFENRVKALEAKEKQITLRESLHSKSIDTSIADFLKHDVDIEQLYTVIDNLVNTKMKSNGYKPSGHNKGGESISKEKWRKMTYQEKQVFYDTNPELAKQFMGK